jgi:hypothetical protein
VILLYKHVALYTTAEKMSSFLIYFYKIKAKLKSFAFGWASWIRTSGMTESKSVALPLGYSPLF